MQDHTQQGLQTSWSELQAQSRAKRVGSSAPSTEELATYRNALKQAIAGQEAPRVLVLGATPELRDLAISLGCRTLAVDISQPVLDAMRAAMAHRDHPYNEEHHGDWLDVRPRFGAGRFSAILGDASLNNVPSAAQAELIKGLRESLVPGGKIIARTCIHYPDRGTTLEDFQRVYEQGKTHWLMFYAALALHTEWTEQVYDKATHTVDVGAFFELVERAMERGELAFSADDEWKVRNVIAHGKHVKHVVFPYDEFIGLFAPHFDLESTETTREWEFTDLFPIFIFKAKT